MTEETTSSMPITEKKVTSTGANGADTQIGSTVEMQLSGIRSWYLIIVLAAIVFIILVVFLIIFAMKKAGFISTSHFYNIITIIARDQNKPKTNDMELANITTDKLLPQTIVSQPTDEDRSSKPGEIVHLDEDDAAVPTSAHQLLPPKPVPQSTVHNKLNATATARCPNEGSKAEPFPVQPSGTH